MVGFGPLASYPTAALPLAGISAALTATLADATLAATGTVQIKGALTATAADVILAATGTVQIKGALTATLDDAIFAVPATVFGPLASYPLAALATIYIPASGALQIKGIVTATLDETTISATSAVQIKANIVVTLDDVAIAAIGDFGTTITDTEVLKLPVNCVLAGQQPIKDRYREWDVPTARRTEKGSMMRSRRGLIGGEKPSFTTRTDHRGYN